MIHLFLQKTGLAAAACMALLSLGGCETAGFIASVFDKNLQPALFTPADQPTLVLVEDAPQPVLDQPDLAGLIAGRVAQILIEQKVITKFTDSGAVAELRARTPDFDTEPAKWNIARIGREVGAQQVLYISIQEFGLTEEGVIFRPRATVRVKFVDAQSGQRLFPPAADQYGSSGHPITTQRNYGSMDGASQATQVILARRLAEDIAQDIARLFYEHTPPEPGERLPG